MSANRDDKILSPIETVLKRVAGEGTPILTVMAPAQPLEQVKASSEVVKKRTSESAKVGPIAFVAPVTSAPEVLLVGTEKEMVIEEAASINKSPPTKFIDQSSKKLRLSKGKVVAG